MKNQGRRRMLLWHLWQGPIGHNPNFKWMKKIYRRKPDTSSSLSLPQESDYLRVNQGAKRSTSRVAMISQAGQLQNDIATRKRRKETCGSHLEIWRSTYHWSRETYKEYGNPATKWTILAHIRERRNQDRWNGASWIPKQGLRNNLNDIWQRQHDSNNEVLFDKRSQGDKGVALGLYE